MGADGSTLQFPDKDIYTKWDISNVRNAYDRYTAMDPTTPPVTLRKMEFMQVFNEFTEGGVLSLQDQFELFDPQGKKAVFAAEPFLLLGLLCDGPLQDKIEFCFKQFDYDHSGAMSSDEMKMLISALIRAMVKVRILKAKPTDEELEDQLKLLFDSADADGDGEITVQEFSFYARDHAWNASVLDHHDSKKPKKKGGSSPGKAGRRASKIKEPKRQQRTAEEARRAKAKAELKREGHVSEHTGVKHLSKSEMQDFAKKNAKKLDRIATQKQLLDLSLQTNFER